MSKVVPPRSDAVSGEPEWIDGRTLSLAPAESALRAYIIHKARSRPGWPIAGRAPYLHGGSV